MSRLQTIFHAIYHWRPFHKHKKSISIKRFTVWSHILSFTWFQNIFWVRFVLMLHLGVSNYILSYIVFNFNSTVSKYKSELFVFHSLVSNILSSFQFSISIHGFQNISILNSCFGVGFFLFPLIGFQNIFWV